MDDQASGRSSVSETKCEPLNSQNNSKVENVTLKQENKSDSYVSGASMAGENELKCEKSNVTVKRSSTQTASLLISKLPKHFSLQQIQEHLEKLVSVYKQICRAESILTDFKEGLLVVC